MNLRIGAFGRQESAAAVWIAAFVSGCFAFDTRVQFADGNTSYLSYAIAVVLSLLLFEAAVRAIKKRNGCDLSALIGQSRFKAVCAVPLIAALLLAAMQPLERFLLTVTQYVFTEAKQVSVCMYLLPCLILLSALGAETLVRTSRIFLPMLLFSFAAAMLLAVPQYRSYRLFPIPLGAPLRLAEECASTLFRTFSPLLALLCIGEGTQNPDALRSAGRIGMLCGAGMTALALLGLSLSFPYTQLAGMPAPFYRLLVEVRTENPTMRLDRATLFLWMTFALLASAFYVYAACVLFAKTFGVRDVRPLAFSMSTIAVTLVLVLYYNAETTRGIVKELYRFAWIPTLAPIPPLLFGTGRRKKPCAV